MKKRTRIDIYASMIKIIDQHDEKGIRLTRVAYGAGIPTDRARAFIDKLMTSGLVAPKKEDNRFYVSTKHGQKFLDSYYVLKGYLDSIEEEF